MKTYLNPNPVNAMSISDEPRYPIKVVVHRTGLTPHAIRVWERRYGAVTPLRTPTNRRLYSEADIERLGLLRQLTRIGHGISRIARVATDELRALSAADTTLAAASPVSGGAASPLPVFQHLEACLDAIQQLAAERLESVLLQASVALGRHGVLEQIIVPLMQHVGELWHAGVLRMTHEHLATAVVRHFLLNMQGAFDGSSTGPQVLVTTPAGQLHEIGALLVVATARMEGWRVMYLGTSLPAEEIASAVQPETKAVALSLVYPPDDANIPRELWRLRQCLQDNIPVLIGGRVAPVYRDVVEAIGAVHIPALSELRTALASLRSGQ
jgi:DNA-binding transcriptional MerR regulator/methylmalonyl-CoA mutase cobalamin-binding subunit